MVKPESKPSTEPDKKRFSGPDTKEIASAHKAVRKKQKNAAAKEGLSFTTNQTSDSHSEVKWDKNASAPKKSVAKEYAKEVVSSSRSEPPPPIRLTLGESVRSKPNMGSSEGVKSAIRRNEGSGPPRPASPSASSVKTTAKNPKVSETRSQPAVKEKSFDTHANEAMSVANSSSKSFSEHADEAMSVANSSKPVAARPQVPSRSKAPKPQQSAPARQESTSPKSSSPKGKKPYPELASAVKAQDSYKSAEQSHAKRTATREKTVAKYAPKKKDKLHSLVEGESKPSRGLASRMAYRGASKVSQKIDDAQLARKKNKYSSAVGKAQEAHNARQEGTYNTPGRLAGRTVKTVGKAAVGAGKFVGKAMSETIKGDVNAVRLAHKVHSEGRAPSSPNAEPNRNVSSRQFSKSSSRKQSGPNNWDD